MNKSLGFWFSHIFGSIMGVAISLFSYLIVALGTTVLIDNKIVADVISLLACLGVAYIATITHMASKRFKILTMVVIIVVFSFGINKIFYLKIYENTFRGMLMDSSIPESAPEHKQLNDILSSHNVKDYMKNITSYQKASSLSFFNLKKEIELSDIENKDQYKTILSLLAREEFLSSAELHEFSNKFCSEVIENFAIKHKDILNENLDTNSKSNKMPNCEVVSLINSIEANNFKGLNIRNISYHDIDIIFNNYLK